MSREGRGVYYETEQPGAETLARHEVRKEAIAHYGGCCGQCGRTALLEFDHIHNDGAAWRKAMDNLPIELWLKRELWPENIVQLLCKACHELKTHGHVSLTTQERMYQHRPRIRNPTMPPRKGTQAIHISLDDEAREILERQTARSPTKSRSDVIDALLKGASQHDTALVAKMVDELKGLKATLPEQLSPLTQLARMAAELDTMKRDYAHILDTLKRVLDHVQAIEAHQREPWLHRCQRLFGMSPRKRLTVQDIRR